MQARWELGRLGKGNNQSDRGRVEVLRDLDWVPCETYQARQCSLFMVATTKPCHD